MKTFALALLAVALPLAAAEPPLPAKIEFNRDVRPILSDRCFRCHGPDKNTREADRRLDVRDDALAEKDGVRAIVPGQPDKSELWLRISSSDPDEQMPPAKEPKQLSARDREVLRRWIEQGAEYQGHWAYAPVARTEAPAGRGAVDHFVRARQKELGLAHVGAADRATLLRRLSYDLTGLPAKAAEIALFEKDVASDAYEKQVERLLAAPAFGERMAVWWLDLARYADSIGYHSDNPRNVWPYRDWVIRAFNENKRFDRFTLEQLAGDLLPDATQETRVGSAFNRLNLTTEEGGAQAKQYEAKTVGDRVRAVGTVWLAHTIGCAECHDHKFDPVTARDFYALGAFFADLKESAIGRREDGMLVPTPAQSAQLAALDAQFATLRAQLDAADPALDTAQAEWERASLAAPVENQWTTLRPAKVYSDKVGVFAIRDDGTVKAEVAGNPAADIYKIEVALPAGTRGLRLEALPSGSLPASGPGRSANGNFVLNEIQVLADSQSLKLAAASATFAQEKFSAAAAIDGKPYTEKKGWAVLGNTGQPAALIVELATPVATETTAVVWLFQRYGDNHTLGKFRLAATSDAGPIRAPKRDVPAEILALLKIDAAARTTEQAGKVRAHFRSVAPALEPLRQEIAAVQTKRAEFEKAIGRCLVSEAAAPRTVRVLPRGDWMNDSGDVVAPATPAFLPAKKTDARPTRLDLAQWLVAPENPLTARVFVNRLWKLCFGAGLAKNLDDFGAQGEPPAHGALLDWLASEFVASGWDVKHVLRLLVTSSVYRQASVAPRELVARDPFNREWARQGRWRMDAEFVRDQALAVSGLLTAKIGGPSVKPYQPPGYWENLNFPTREWENDKDADQWRRGLYTWWQRSFLHPAMAAFDAPSREECTAERIRSNIPQQALVLLNDAQFVEAARAFAARIVREGGADSAARLAWAFREVTGRAPTTAEAIPLAELLGRHTLLYRQDGKAAEALLATGYSPAPKDGDLAELAAWTNVARALLNLHETITRG